MIKVTSFYKFFFHKKKPRLKALRRELLKKASELNIRGLIIIGEEGINGALAGKGGSLKIFKKSISSLFEKKFFWKDSECEKWNFKRFSVKIKKEIINLGKNYSLSENELISPEKWEKKDKK